MIPEHEFLTADEVSELTGRTHRDKQLEWLAEHGWRSEVNAAGRPVVGRWYARMKMAGMDFSQLSPGKLPNFDMIR